MKKPTNLLRFIILILAINFIMQMFLLLNIEIFCNCSLPVDGENEVVLVDSKSNS